MPQLQDGELIARSSLQFRRAVVTNEDGLRLIFGGVEETEGENPESRKAEATVTYEVTIAKNSSLDVAAERLEAAAAMLREEMK